MNHCPPHLLHLAVVHLLDEVRGNLRHTIRNKLGGARNAAFYLRKKVQATDLPAKDARVNPFFDIIFDAVEGSVALLESVPLPERGSSETDAAEALNALAGAVLLPAGVSLEVAVPSAPRLAIDAEELQVAVFFALGPALDSAAARGGALRLAGRLEDTLFMLDVVDVDAAAGVLDSGAPDAPPTGLPPFTDVARRMLARWNAELDAPGAGDGVRATLRIPTVAAEVA